MERALTDQQKLAQFKADTGLGLILRPHEKLIATRVTESAVAVTVETYKVVETARELRFIAKGTKMYAWTMTDGAWVPMIQSAIVNGAPIKLGYIIMWDDTFVPEITIKLGRVRTPAEDRAQREWERDCYRPGTSSNPLDNYDRVLAGAYAPAETKIERHW